MPQGGTDYVLLTAARNEAAFIEGTIRSVLLQSHRPLRWVIVSDGSTDETDRIVQRYAGAAEFIAYARTGERRGGVDFAKKVQALHRGRELLQGLHYDFIGNLDADITFGPGYFQELLEIFRKNPHLGVAGGRLYEPYNGKFVPRYLSEERYVPGAVQLFRRECFEQIGGYVLNRWGGEDTIAVVAARMKGWQTASVATLQVFHHKVGEANRGWAQERFREGTMFYSMGSHPLFELLKCLRWLGRKPLFLQGAVRLWGYAWACFRGEGRPVSAEFVRYLRSEQRARLMNVLRKTS
ncbi:MAG: glycosyltransferase family 2 protein [Desulfobacterales bacterium]